MKGSREVALDGQTFKKWPAQWLSNLTFRSRELFSRQ